MTVIIGVDCGQEIVVLADTRVSYDVKSGKMPVDKLIKLMHVDFFQSKAILGFSGNIAYIKSIVESLKRKAKYYRSSGNLENDFKVWIEEAIHMRPDRCTVQFMLCQFDPSEKAILVIYNVGTDGTVEIELPKITRMRLRNGHIGQGTVAIIGSGVELKREICESALIKLGDPKTYNDYNAYSDIRMMLIKTQTAYHFENINSPSVGGPFVIMRLRPSGIIGPNYMLPNDADYQMTEDGKKVILSSHSTNENYTLYSIFNYKEADFSQHADTSA